MRFSHWVIFAGWCCLGTAGAQVNSTAQSQAGPAASPSQPIIWTGNTNVTLQGPGGSMPYGSGPYGSGRYPNLQGALVALDEAETQLRGANPSGKAEFLPRAIGGVALAMSDVKLAIDFADGAAMPTNASLAQLPPGVGNASSGIKIVPATTLKFASPNMDSAMIYLQKALADLKSTTASNKGIYLARAIADVNFAIDNANAAVNLANGVPPPASKSAGAPATQASNGDISTGEIIGLLVAVLAVSVFALVQVIRRTNAA